MVQSDILTQLYTFGLQHKLVPAVTRAGYDPLSFLRIATDAQLTDTVKYGALVGATEWIIVELVVNLIIFGFLGFRMTRSYSRELLNSVIKAPLLEETVYRLLGITGILYFTGSLFWAVAITSICFGLIHLYQGITVAVLSMFGGVVLAFAFLTGGFLAAIAAHAMHNLISTIFSF